MQMQNTKEGKLDALKAREGEVTLTVTVVAVAMFCAAMGLMEATLATAAGVTAVAAMDAATKALD